MYNYFLTVLPPRKANGGRNGGKTSASLAMTGSCFNVKLSEVIFLFQSGKFCEKF